MAFRGNGWEIVTRSAFAVSLWLAAGQCLRAESPRAAPSITLTANDFEQPVCVFVHSLDCPQSLGPYEPTCDFTFDFHGSDQRVYRVSEEALFRALPATVPVLIIVHGSFVDIDKEPDLLETFQMIRDGGGRQPLLVLCYRWPSTIGCKVLLGSCAICELAQRAEFNGFYLTQLIARVPAANSIRLLGHSHGTRVISSALHLLSGGVVDGKTLRPALRSNRAFRVTFCASAIDHDWLNPGQCYELALSRMCWLQNFKNSTDWALLTYPLRYPGSSHALGQWGFTRKDRRRLGAQAAKIQQVDHTRLLGLRHRLVWYCRHPQILPMILNNIYSP